MKCVRDGCRGELRVTHTYTVEHQRFQRARCQGCGAVHALTAEARLASAQGRGAKALAAAARRARKDPEQ